MPSGGGGFGAAASVAPPVPPPLPPPPSLPEEDPGSETGSTDLGVTPGSWWVSGGGVGSVSVVFGVDPVEGVSSPESPEGEDFVEGVVEGVVEGECSSSGPSGENSIEGVSSTESLVTESLVRGSSATGVSFPESPGRKAPGSLHGDWALTSEISMQLGSATCLGGGFVSPVAPYE